MDKSRFSIDDLRSKFRYNIKQLIAFEFDETVRATRSRTITILLTGFIIYSIITIYPCIIHRYNHGIVANTSITLLFILCMVHLKIFKNHVATTLFGTYGLCLILFFNFIMEIDWTLGMDAFWLFILITPFVTDYLAGVVFGTIAALAGLILSYVCFHTRVLGYLQPYGRNMVQWYTVIYLVVMLSAAVIEYELTAFQIDKKKYDENIAFYQAERTQRLKKLLDVYESNEASIRRYKHDMRHYNRVLLSFIENKEYDKAASYLKEIDSTIESVTPVSFCDNTIVNELLSIYAAQCQKLGFKLRAKASVPKMLPIEETDLTSLVANALENCFEAQRQVDKDKRSIQVEIKYEGHKLKLQTKNPTAVSVEFGEDGLPISTREVPSGIGTAQIKAIAEKYAGAAVFSEENKIFTVRAIMTCM